MRALRNIGLSVAFAGAVLMAAAAACWNASRSFVADSVTARGTIIDLVPYRATAGLEPVVEFRPRGGEPVRFVAPAGRRGAACVKGRTVPIRYDPADPYAARIDSFKSLWLAPIVTGAAGAVLAATGVVASRAAFRAARRRRWLLAHGRPVSTEFQAVTRGRQSAPGLPPPYHVITRWRDPSSGIHYTFTSEAVSLDPAPYAEVRPIIVRINPRNPRRYVMDTSFLPRARATGPIRK